MASTGNRSGKAQILRASVTRPPMANTSLQALAAATAPKSAGSSTSGGKKSVVETNAKSSESRRTAASSNGARPTNRPLDASSAAIVRTRSARGEPPHFAAQPPQVVHSVRFTVPVDISAPRLGSASPRGSSVVSIVLVPRSQSLLAGRLGCSPPRVFAVSAVRRLGPGKSEQSGPSDPEITTPAGHAGGVEMGNQRQDVLACRAERLADHRDRKPVGMPNEELEEDAGRSVDRRRREPHTVPLDHEALALHGSQVAAIDPGRVRGRERLGAQRREKRVPLEPSRSSPRAVLAAAGPGHPRPRCRRGRPPRLVWRSSSGARSSPDLPASSIRCMSEVRFAARARRRHHPTSEIRHDLLP